MSRLTTATLETATGATAEVFAKLKKRVGKVPNAFATIGTHSPDGLQAIFAIDAAAKRALKSTFEERVPRPARRNESGTRTT